MASTVPAAALSPADLPPPPPMEVFRDIQVISPMSLREPGLTYRERTRRSGPIWPDFDAQTWVRHSFGGELVDRRPTPVTKVADVIEEPCVWLGFAQAHFGHLIAEHLTRALWSSTLRPDDRFLLLASPKAQTTGSAPGYILDVLAWYGVRREQLVLLREPVLARELRVVPQAETLGGQGPDAAYLDLLELNTARMGLEPIASEFLYVTRAGMAGGGRGGHCGEHYLVNRLAERGVRILDPGKTPLRTQLALYAGARTIIFAEGSAAHGRQLLGRVDQRIVVLNRRPGRRIAEASLEPRCAGLQYIEAARAICEPVSARSNDVISRAICFYDVDRLIEGLSAVGLDIGTGWDNEAYRSACDADVTAWLAHVRDDTKFLNYEATLAALASVPPGPVPDGSGPRRHGLDS